MTRKNDRNSAPPLKAANPYQPSGPERAAVQRWEERQKGGPLPPKIKVEHSDARVSLDLDHPDAAVATALLADTFCSSDLAFVHGIVEQLTNVARTGKKLKSDELNFMLSTVCGINPRDPTEALLAVQMAAIHNATMMAARRLNGVENIPQQDSASNMLNKLARTFATQMEALKRYRSTGDQNIRVQHVNVSADQAVVGISQGGGVSHEKSSQSDAPCGIDERSTTMLGNQQALGMPLPSTSGERKERVPDAWRSCRRAKGKGQRRMAARARDK